MLRAEDACERKLRPAAEYRSEVLYRPQLSIHRLGRGYRRFDGCVIMPVDGRGSTQRASLFSIDDKLTVPFRGVSRNGLSLARPYPAPSAWARSNRSLEGTGEMALIRKTARVGDLLEGHL
jgi:hypothetical protein